MRGTSFNQPISKPQVVGPERSVWFWNPNNQAIQFAPNRFRKQLKEFDAELECTWNPIQEHWTIWMRKPSVNTKLCQGWMLLFNVQPRSLDDRVFARLYQASGARWGRGKDYFLAIEREMERDKDQREKQSRQESIDRAMPAWEHSRIRVGYGPSSGSKFSDYHA